MRVEPRPRPWGREVPTAPVRLPSPAPSHRPGARAWALLRGSRSGVCGRPGATLRIPAPKGRAGESKGKESTADRTDTSCLLRVLFSQALRFPPRFSSSLSTQMNSHSFLVTKKKGNLLFHPLHVPCFHHLHKASPHTWSEAGDAQDAPGRVPCGSPLRPGLWQPRLPTSLRGVGAG